MQTILRAEKFPQTPPAAFANGPSLERPLIPQQIAGLQTELREHQVHPLDEWDFRGVPDSALHD